MLYDLWWVCYIKREEMLRYFVCNRDLKLKSILWIYVLNLDFCNYEKKSYNWKEYYLDYLYIIFLVLYVDG